MSEPDRTSPSTRNEVEITLGLLNAVQENSAITQRSAAGQLGIALGLANAYLKRCVKKGWIKVQQIPPNRYAYYLTPKGFAEKSRLTAEYLSSSFNFFRRARAECEEMLGSCAVGQRRRIALWGVSELAEIMTLCASEFDVTLLGIVDGDSAREVHTGLRVVRSLMDLDQADAVIITDLRHPQDAYERLRRLVPEDRILTPSLLRVARNQATVAAE